MNRSLQYLVLWLTVVTTAILGGCGGGGGSTPVLSISGPTAVGMDQGQPLAITDIGQHLGSQGVTWTCSGAACTSTCLTNETDYSATFTANGSTGTATVTVTSVKDTRSHFKTLYKGLSLR